MRRLVETILFSGLATLIHVALFAQSNDNGHEGGGSGGAALVSLKAADATVAEMVERWERAPQPTPVLEPELPDAPVLDAPAMDFPQLDLAEAAQGDLPRQRPAMPQKAVPPEPEAAPPIVKTSPAEPLSKTAPRASLRAPPRPKAPPRQERTETARKAETTTPARAAQRAAGAGGGEEAGKAQRAQTATASKGQQAKAHAVWGAKIRQRITRAKRYPRGTRASGEVSLAISIARSGQLLGVVVRQSSGNAALDRAAVEAVRRAGRFPAAPDALTQNSYTFALAVLLKR